MSRKRDLYLARLRNRFTGEPLNTIRRDRGKADPQESLIPAASSAQAALETQLLRPWGYNNYCGWNEGIEEWRSRRFQYSPFGFRYLIPRRDEIEINLHPTLLPRFVDEVLPKVEHDGTEIYGIPGLRAQVHDRFVLLRRIDEQGQIRVRADSKSWHSAVAKVVENEELRKFAWLVSPDAWLSSETIFHQRYGCLWDFGQGGNQFVSDLLRRSHALKNEKYIPYWHLWRNLGSIELEWRGGPTHCDVLALLLHPEWGLDARLKDPGAVCHCNDERPTSDEVCYQVRVTGKCGLDLHLRRQPAWTLDR